MRWAWIGIVAGCGASSQQRPMDGPHGNIEGTLRVQPPGLCGGVAPPPEYRDPQLAPAPGVVLRVMPGERYSENMITQATTRADGTFIAQVPYGSYCLARDHGAKPTRAPSEHHELACLVQRWQSCDAVVTVPITAPVQIDIHEGCSWASCYHGPPPP